MKQKDVKWQLLTMHKECKGEAEQLRHRAGNLDRGYIAEYEQRVKAETEDTKAKLKAAMDAGRC